MLIGHIAKIARYPFKSMAAEFVKRGYITYSGLQGDRIFSLIKKDGRKDFPWLSARDVPRLILIKPSYIRLPGVDTPYPSLEDYELELQFVDGRKIRTSDPALMKVLQLIVGEQCELRFSEKSMVDARPLSLISQQTIEAVAAEVNQKIDCRRFRANIYVRWINSNPFQEDDFIGEKLKIGEKCEIIISKKDPRCAIVTVDPDSAIRNSEILKFIVKKRSNNLGVYAIASREGTICVGDEIFITS